MKKVIVLFVLLYSFSALLCAQSDNIYDNCTHLKMGGAINPLPGDTITVPVYISETVHQTEGFLFTVSFDTEFLRFIGIEKSSSAFDVSHRINSDNSINIQSQPFGVGVEFSVSSSAPIVFIQLLVRKEYSEPLEIAFDHRTVGTKYFLDRQGDIVELPGISGYVFPEDTGDSPLLIYDFCLDTDSTSCEGTKIATVFVEGGTPPYQYTWTYYNMEEPDSLPTIVLDREGPFRFTVMDADSQMLSAAVVFYGTPQVVDVDYEVSVIQPQNCNEYGRVSVEPSRNFDFEWSDGSEQLNRTDLLPGSYQRQYLRHDHRQRQSGLLRSA